MAGRMTTVNCYENVTYSISRHYFSSAYNLLEGSLRKFHVV